MQLAVLIEYLKISFISKESDEHTVRFILHTMVNKSADANNDVGFPMDL